MSGVTGEIGFKIGAAGAKLPGVNRPFTGQNNTALTVNGVPGTFALAITGAAQPDGAPGTGVGIVSNGLLINAGNGSNDVVALIQGGGNGAPGTSTYLRMTANAGGYLGYNVNGTGVVNWNNQGLTWLNAGQLVVLSANNVTTYVSLGLNGLKMGNITGGTPPVLIYAQGGTNTIQFSIGFTGAAGTAQGVTLGTSTLYAISTGTPYPVLQFAGVGAITGTGTIGLNIMAGGLYYNGTNYIYGQAGTGIVASLGTGSFTVSCFNTSGTAAGTATPTVVFSIGGTVTSNQIKGYGPAAAALVDMTPDFWLGTATVALAANAFATATVARVGPVTTIWVPAVTGSGNGATTTMVVTVPMPAAFQNSGTLSFNLAIEAAGTSQMGLCNYSGTTFTMFPAITGGTFTAITNRGIVNGILMSWPNAQS